MTLNRAINRIDHVKRAPGRASVHHVPGFDIERKEFGGLAALLHARDTGAIRSRRGSREIVIVIRRRRRDVVVRVDDDGAAMNGQRSLPKNFIASGAPSCWSSLCGLFHRGLFLRWLSSPLRAAWDCEREE